jgi:hypothetical protein
MQEPSQLMEPVLQPVCADARACAATLRRLRETGYQLAPPVKFEELPQQCRHSAPACIIAILRRDSELAPAFAALQECRPVPFVLVFPEALAEAVAETFQPLRRQAFCLNLFARLRFARFCAWHWHALPSFNRQLNALSGSGMCSAASAMPLS